MRLKWSTVASCNSGYHLRSGTWGLMVFGHEKRLKERNRLAGGVVRGGGAVLVSL